MLRPNIGDTVIALIDNTEIEGVIKKVDFNEVKIETNWGIFTAQDNNIKILQQKVEPKYEICLDYDVPLDID